MKIVSKKMVKKTTKDKDGKEYVLDADFEEITYDNGTVVTHLVGKEPQQEEEQIQDIDNYDLLSDTEKAIYDTQQNVEYLICLNELNQQ